MARKHDHIGSEHAVVHVDMRVERMYLSIAHLLSTGNMNVGNACTRWSDHGSTDDDMHARLIIIGCMEVMQLPMGTQLCMVYTQSMIQKQ